MPDKPLTIEKCIELYEEREAERVREEEAKEIARKREEEAVIRDYFEKLGVAFEEINGSTVTLLVHGTRMEIAVGNPMHGRYGFSVAMSECQWCHKMKFTREFDLTATNLGRVFSDPEKYVESHLCQPDRLGELNE